MVEEGVRGWWKKVCGDGGRRCAGMVEEGVRGWWKKVCGDGGRRCGGWWKKVCGDVGVECLLGWDGWGCWRGGRGRAVDYGYQGVEFFAFGAGALHFYQVGAGFQGYGGGEDA